MSERKLRGREYLQAVRPDAMRHLLAYYGEAGRHLEPKTRFLISVLKQVVHYSPRGLRQYIRRAMQEGASRDEIIDTMLLAYPLANLTKLADSVDILLDLEAEGALPTREPLPGQEGEETGAWQSVTGVAPPGEGACVVATVGGKELLLARHAGRLYAVDDTCPHRGGSLHEGTLEGDVVTCPLHGFNYHLSDGSAAGVGRGGLATYPVREREGRLEVRLAG